MDPVAGRPSLFRLLLDLLARPLDILTKAVCGVAAEEGQTNAEQSGDENGSFQRCCDSLHIPWLMVVWVLRRRDSASG